MRSGVAAAFVAAILLGGCSDGSGSAGDDAGPIAPSSTTTSTAPPFAEADATTALDVTLQDYAFIGVPDTVAGPNVLFRAAIKGPNVHELVVFDADGDRVGGVGPFTTPARHSVAVALAPGTYTIVCNIKESTRTHAQLGMRNTIVVT